MTMGEEIATQARATYQVCQRARSRVQHRYLCRIIRSTGRLYLGGHCSSELMELLAGARSRRREGVATFRNGLGAIGRLSCKNKKNKDTQTCDNQLTKAVSIAQHRVLSDTSHVRSMKVKHILLVCRVWVA